MANAAVSLFVLALSSFSLGYFLAKYRTSDIHVHDLASKMIEQELKSRCNACQEMELLTKGKNPGK